MPSKSETSIRTKLRSRRKTIAIASGLLTALAMGVVPFGTSSPALLSPQVADAQNFGQRTIQGKVLADTGAPVGGATVFLKNLKTRNIKSFTSIPDGSFRFAQVGMIDDYEVWAEQGKLKSAVKTVSSFDSRKVLEFDLKLK
jgi:uncharacterized membrane protein YbjE (DUF340 family)